MVPLQDELMSTSLCYAIVCAYSHHSVTPNLKNGADWLFQKLAPETYSIWSVTTRSICTLILENEILQVNSGYPFNPTYH